MSKKAMLSSMYGLMLGTSLLRVNENYSMPHNPNKWNYHHFKKHRGKRK